MSWVSIDHRSPLRRDRPELLLDDEAVEAAVVVGDGDGAGADRAVTLPEHRVGVHVGAGLGDAEPREVTHRDAVEPFADVEAMISRPWRSSAMNRPVMR